MNPSMLAGFKRSFEDPEVKGKTSLKELNERWMKLNLASKINVSGINLVIVTETSTPP